MVKWNAFMTVNSVGDGLENGGIWSMKIVSQNVMCWEHTDGALFVDRRPLMREAVIGADIIGFQEVTPYWCACFEEDLPGYEKILVYRGAKSLEAAPV